MTTTYHTPIAEGAEADAATFNAPLGELDAELVSQDGRLDTIEAAGTGEDNTASNVGTAGVGVFKQKSGVDLEFKKINAGSAKVTITDDTGNDEVDIDVDPAQIAHGDLQDTGTSTHAQIDTHLGSTSNPHSVTAAQAGAVATADHTKATHDALGIEAADLDIGGMSAEASPTTGDKLVVERSGTRKKIDWDDLPGSGGESNTASNVGTAGVGVFKQKSGVDLEFKKINAGSSKVSIADDTGNDEVDIDVVESNVNHDNLAGFVADEHSPSASASEVNTGTETGKHITPDALAGSNLGTKNASIQITDGSAAIETGDGKGYMRIGPEMNGMNLVSVGAAVTAPSTSGVITISIERGRQAAPGSAHTWVDMLSTSITIDANEYDSKDAAAAAVINTSNDDVQTGDLIRWNIDGVGSGPTAVLVGSAGFRLP